MHNVKSEARFALGRRWLHWRRPDYTAVREFNGRPAARSTSTWSGWVAATVAVGLALSHLQVRAVEQAGAGIDVLVAPTWLAVVIVGCGNWAAFAAGAAWRKSRTPGSVAAIAGWTALWCSLFGVLYGWSAATGGLLVIAGAWMTSRALQPPRRAARLRRLITPDAIGRRASQQPSAAQREAVGAESVAHGMKRQRARAFILQYLAEHGEEPTGAQVDAEVDGRSTGRAVLNEMRKAGELVTAERAASA